MWWARRRKVWLAILLFVLTPMISGTEVVEEETVVEEEVVVEVEEEEVDLVVCYSCGLDEIDPVADGMGYCDMTKDSECSSTAKMYNHTCDIFSELGASEAWMRTCPRGVKSCFVAKGLYDGQAPYFRGCAEAHFEHDPKCQRELQAVTVVAGRQTVDVEIHLCYCSGRNCNMELSGAEEGATAAAVAVAGGLLIAYAMNN